MASAAVTQLASEVQTLRAQRDAALAREAETTFGLQRMLGADKAIGVVMRALWGDCLAALLVWRRHASEMSLNTALAAADPDRRRYAEALAADSAARLEIEESRRVDAEKLAFDEGKRRRRAEAELMRVREELRLTSEELALARRGVAFGIGERAAEALAYRRELDLLSRSLGAWRVACSEQRLARSEARYEALAPRIAELESAAAEAEASRLSAAAQSDRAGGVLRDQLESVLALQLEAQNAMQGLQQEREEAIERAARQEKELSLAAEDAEALDARHAEVIARLGDAAAGVRALRKVGPHFRRWGRRAAVMRERQAGERAAVEAAAAAEAAMREKVEASARDAAHFAASAEAARDDGERSTAAAEMRLRRCETSRHAERRRHAIEAGVLLAAELRACEKRLRSAEAVGEAVSSRLREVVQLREELGTAHAAMRAWRAWREEAREARLRGQLEDARAARQAAAERSAQLARWLDDSRGRSAALMGESIARRHAAHLLGCWRSHTSERQRHKAAEAAEAQAEASARREAELDRALQTASDELQSVGRLLSESRHAFEEEGRRRRGVESELEEARGRLAASERGAREEAARAKELEEEASALQVELEACELKLLMLDAQAVRQAEDIHEQLRDTLVASPNPGKGGAFAAARGGAVGGGGGMPAAGGGGLLGGLSSGKGLRRKPSPLVSAAPAAAAATRRYEQPGQIDLVQEAEQESSPPSDAMRVSCMSAADE